MPMFQLSLTAHKPNVLVTSEAKGLYVLVEIRPGDARPTAAPPVNLILVVDRSPSMEEQGRFENALAATEEVIDRLRPQEILSVVGFDSHASTIDIPDHNRDKQAVKRAIHRGLRIGSGTMISTGLEEAMRIIRQRQVSGMVNRILLVTDGETGGDEAVCRHLAKSMRERRVTMTTVGLGRTFNHELLQELADATMGRAYQVVDARELPGVFDKEFAGAQSVVLQNPELLLRLADGITVRSLTRIAPELILANDVKLEREMRVKLGDLQGDTIQSLLLMLALPSRPAGRYRIMEAAVESNGARPEGTSALLVDYVESADLAGAIIPTVMVVVDRAQALKAQTMAIAAAQQGDMAKATRLLTSTAEIFRKQGQHDLAQAAEAEAANLAHGGQMSDSGTKKLTYGTRKITSPSS